MSLPDATCRNKEQGLSSTTDVHFDHTGYLPPVKAETNHYPATLSADYGHILQDPSQFNIDHFTQLGSGANGGSTAGGPDRTRRGRQGAAKRTGACARCRRLKVISPRSPAMTHNILGIR